MYSQGRPASTYFMNAATLITGCGKFFISVGKPPASASGG